MCLSRVSRLASFCSCTVTGAWMCFSAFSTTESSLCQRVGGVGWWVEWVGTLRGGQVERRERQRWRGVVVVVGGVGGVTRLPGCDLIRLNLPLPPATTAPRLLPAAPTPPLLQLVNKTTTQKPLAVNALCCSRVHSLYVELPKQSRAKQNELEAQIAKEGMRSGGERGRNKNITSNCKFQHSQTHSQKKR